MSAPHEHVQMTERMRNRLAFGVVGAFIMVLPFLLFKTIAEANKDIIVYMLGQLSGMATTALSLYFGSKSGQDALDARRSETTGKLADAVVAAANSTPAQQPVDADPKEGQ